MNLKYKKCCTEDIWTPVHFKVDMTNWFHNDTPYGKTYCGNLQACDRRDSREKLSLTNWQIQNKERSNSSITTTICPNESINSEISPSYICSSNMEYCSPTNQSAIIRFNDPCDCYLSLISSNSRVFDCISESTGENIVTDESNDSCQECLRNKSQANVTQRKKMPVEEDRLSEFDEYCQYEDWERIYRILMRDNCIGEKLTDKPIDDYVSCSNDDLPRPHRKNEMHADLNDNIFVNMNRPKKLHGHCMFYKECVCHDKNKIV
ncbi:uncharacterized protein LOC107263642 [Cephus cinctus]|uniref:Uncharacterized protein LOC107263642 n=1 Tax=Cephus cinctus TaxID=211228 RepID=A0AAJ7R9E8_CEPCN|nr:uncharacterized protein LOC107263642 [Cephus cinctus]